MIFSQYFYEMNIRFRLITASFNDSNRVILNKSTPICRIHTSALDDFNLKEKFTKEYNLMQNSLILVVQIRWLWLFKFLLWNFDVRCAFDIILLTIVFLMRWSNLICRMKKIALMKNNNLVMISHSTSRKRLLILFISTSMMPYRVISDMINEKSISRICELVDSEILGASSLSQ